MSDSRERERLNRRIATIKGTDVSKELRAYRNRLMRKAPKPGQLNAHSVAGASKDYWHWEDEIRLCHEFLDRHGVDQMRS